MCVIPCALLKKMKERVTRTLQYISITHDWFNTTAKLQPLVFLGVLSACTRRRLLVKQIEHRLIVCDGHAYARGAAEQAQGHARNRATFPPVAKKPPMRAIKSVISGTQEPHSHPLLLPSLPTDQQ